MVTTGFLSTLRKRWAALNPLAPTRDPLAFFTACARRGDVVPLRSHHGPVFFLNHPDYIEQVLAGEQRKFVKGPLYRRGLGFMGDGLLTSEGELWRGQRRATQPAFHRQRVAGYADAIMAEAERALADWQAGETRDVHRAMAGITLLVVARTLFGQDAAAYAESMNAAHEAIMERYLALQRSPVYHYLPDGFPTRAEARYRLAERRLQAIAGSAIRSRPGSGAGDGDLLGMLLAARDEGAMDERELRDQVVSFFLAGHETTANALTWAWYLLAQNPQVEARLHGELHAALGGRRPALADLPALRYTECVIREAMRLYPPVWMISREAAVDTAIGDVPVPAGSQVMFSQWVMHRDARYYAAPECFEPGRWLDGLERRLPRYAYFPFGGGPRMCVGHQFAMMEAVLLLARIAQDWRLALVPGYRVELQPSITLRPRRGLPMQVSPVSSPS
jgi:cytochrome P450